ncbi:MAG: hypothetical protein J6P73_01280, partial [Bacteroidales bacterium]|nr:hypothetical protein [Bacteroidales bacterium]
VNEIEKIVANDPNAIQAKVLMVRAVNLIERALLTTSLDADDNEALYPSWKASESETMAFFNQALRLCDIQRRKSSDTNFWNLVASYLNFLNQDFPKASSILADVKSNDELYMKTVNCLTAYIDLCRQSTIDAKTEDYLFGKYPDLFTNLGVDACCNNLTDHSFANLVLHNRYARQDDHAKSYLVLNTLQSLEDNPNEKLLDEIQSFLNKKKKTALEQYLAEKGTMGLDDYNNYIAYFKGVLRLTEGNFKEAKKQFEKQTRLMESKRIFGHNIEVYYSGDEKDIMRDDYISEFPFIRDNMTELDVTNALIQLQKIGDKKGDEAAKANYLIANFYYNVSVTGYYRHYLRFDNNNGFCYDKYGSYGNEPYKNTLQLSSNYLEKAMKTASDNELKAHIVFAQAKNAQQQMEASEVSSWEFTRVVPHAQFDILDQFKGTVYQKDVYSNCLYYSNYHN